MRKHALNVQYWRLHIWLVISPEKKSMQLSEKAHPLMSHFRLHLFWFCFLLPNSVIPRYYPMSHTIEFSCFLVWNVAKLLFCKASTLRTTYSGFFLSFSWHFLLSPRAVLELIKWHTFFFFSILAHTVTSSFLHFQLDGSSCMCDNFDFHIVISNLLCFFYVSVWMKSNFRHTCLYIKINELLSKDSHRSPFNSPL